MASHNWGGIKLISDASPLGTHIRGSVTGLTDFCVKHLSRRVEVVWKFLVRHVSPLLAIKAEEDSSRCASVTCHTDWEVTDTGNYLRGRRNFMKIKE